MSREASEQSALREMISYFERLIESHINRIKAENAGHPAVEAVLPQWNRLAEPPLSSCVAERLVDLLKGAVAADELKYETIQVNDAWLIVSVAPAFPREEAMRYFEPDQYSQFTMQVAGAADALLRGQWVAHWTLCTDARQEPAIHLTVLPSVATRQSRPALMTWAQDLLTDREWQELPAFVEQWYSTEEPQKELSDADLAFLAEVADQVVNQRQSWEEAAHVVRSGTAASQISNVVVKLRNASQSLRSMGPEPAGFVAAALCCELPELAADGSSQLSAQVVSWALWHPLHDERFMPIRIRLCDRIIPLTSREREPLKWAALQHMQGISYAQCASGDPSRNTEAACGCYRAALSVLSSREHPALWGRLQRNLGDAYVDRTRDDQAENIEAAIAYHQSALTIFSKDDDPGEWADAMHGLGRAYAARIRGDAAENQQRALDFYEAALTVRTRSDQPEKWADTQARLGILYIERTQGDRSENIEVGIRCCLDALKVFSAEAIPGRWANVRNVMGNAYCERVSGDIAENLETAIRCYRDALTVFSHDSQPADWARIQNNLGTAFEVRVRGTAAENIEESIRCYRNALTIRTRAKMPIEWAVTQHNLGTALFRRAEGNRGENIEGAIRAYKAALTIRTRESSPAEWAMTQNDIGCAWRERIQGNRVENLKRALNCFRAALSVRTVTSMPADHAATMNNLGIAYSRLSRDLSDKNLAKAAECHETAGTMCQTLGIRQEAVRSYRLLGGVHMQLEDWRHARHGFEKAVSLVESALEDSYSEHAKNAWMSAQAEVYDGLVASHLHLSGQTKGDQKNKHLEHACYWAERGRARFLAELIDASEQVPRTVGEAEFRRYQEDLQRFRDTSRRLETLERRRSASGGETFSDQQTAESITAYQSANESLSRRIQESRHRFSQADPDWIPGSAAMSVAAIQKVAIQSNAGLLTLRPTQWGTCAVLLLPNGTIHGGIIHRLKTSTITDMLVQFAGDEPVGGWMVAASSISTSRDDEAESECEGWNETVDKTLQQLGTLLWKPLQKLLQKHYPPLSDPNQPRPLIIFSGMGLSILPLHAAWWEVDGDRRWACDEYQISYAPGTGVLNRCLQRDMQRTDNSESLLAVCNPTGDLTSADWEVRSACSCLPAHLVLGDRASHRPATRLQLMNQLPEFTVALFATHGTYNLHEPWNGTGLCTADAPKTDDGQPYFTLRDIFQLRLSDVRLVVLSACESALSDYRDATGEQLGLPSAFLASGVATAVGSLWVVDDLATALLSRRFFEELFGPDADPRTTKALALWRAQRWLRHLTTEELKHLLNTVPSLTEHNAGRTAVLQRAARDMIRVAQQQPPGAAGKPFAHPAQWSAFACFGSPW